MSNKRNIRPVADISKPSFSQARDRMFHRNFKSYFGPSRGYKDNYRGPNRDRYNARNQNRSYRYFNNPNPRPNHHQHFRSRPQKPISRPASPVEGSEEYMKRKIQQTSAIIMRHLLTPEDNILNVEKSKRNKEDSTDVENISDNSKKSGKRRENKNSVNCTSSSKIKNRDQYNVEEIYDKIMNHITNLNDGRKKNLINSNESGYDAVIQQIQKQKRLEVTRALRDMCLTKTQESTDFINSIIPDVGIKIEDLPVDVIEELRNTLNLDFDEHVQGDDFNPNQAQFKNQEPKKIHSNPQSFGNSTRDIPTLPQSENYGETAKLKDEFERDDFNPSQSQFKYQEPQKTHSNPQPFGNNTLDILTLPESENYRETAELKDEFERVDFNPNQAQFEYQEPQKTLSNPQPFGNTTLDTPTLPESENYRETDKLKDEFESKNNDLYQPKFSSLSDIQIKQEITDTRHEYGNDGASPNLNENVLSELSDSSFNLTVKQEVIDGENVKPPDANVFGQSENLTVESNLDATLHPEVTENKDQFNDSLSLEYLPNENSIVNPEVITEQTSAVTSKNNVLSEVSDSSFNITVKQELIDDENVKPPDANVFGQRENLTVESNLDATLHPEVTENKDQFNDSLSLEYLPNENNIVNPEVITEQTSAVTSKNIADVTTQTDIKYFISQSINTNKVFINFDAFFEQFILKDYENHPTSGILHKISSIDNYIEQLTKHRQSLLKHIARRHRLYSHKISPKRKIKEKALKKKLKEKALKEELKKKGKQKRVLNKSDRTQTTTELANSTSANISEENKASKKRKATSEISGTPPLKKKSINKNKETEEKTNSSQTSDKQKCKKNSISKNKETEEKTNSSQTSDKQKCKKKSISKNKETEEKTNSSQTSDKQKCKKKSISKTDKETEEKKDSSETSGNPNHNEKRVIKTEEAVEESSVEITAEDILGSAEDEDVKPSKFIEIKDEIRKVKEEWPLLQLPEVKEKVLVIKHKEDTIVAGTEYGKIYLCHSHTGHLTYILEVHNVAITSILFIQSNNLTTMYVGSGDLKIYNFKSKRLVKSLSTEDSIQCMEDRWGYIFMGCRNGTLLRYSIRKEKFEFEERLSHKATILVVKATQEGSRRILLIGSRNCPVVIRDAMSGLHMRTLDKVISPTVYSLLLENNLVYCGTTSDYILVFSFHEGKLVTKLSSSKKDSSQHSAVGCMKIVKNLLFASCHNGNIYVYNIKRNEYIDVIPGPGGIILSLEVLHNQVVLGTMALHYMAIPIPEHILRHYQ